MLRILTNLYINDHNHRKRWGRRGRRGDADIVRRGWAGKHARRACRCPGVTLMADTLDEELETALAQLSKGLRLCVILVDMQGLEYAEAASALGIPIGTVRSRLARARMQLQDILRDFGRRRRLV